MGKFRVMVGDMVVTRRMRAAVGKVLGTNWLSPGEKCREFEEEFARVHGAKYGVFMNSGTDALRIAVGALKEVEGWKDGEKVVCPATTFVATVNVVLQNGLTPLLMDNGLHGFNVDRMEHFDNEGTYYKGCRAVMPVHLCGYRSDPRRLMEFAKDRGLRVIEDSCESMGVGPIFGDVACYSTYVCHLISTGVGGVALTNDRRLADLMRSFANHGRDFSNIPGFRNGSMQSRFKYDRIGYSARPTEMQAAIGLEQLKGLRENVGRRQEIADKLSNGLWEFWNDLEVPLSEHENAFMMFPIQVKGEISKVKRDHLCAFLEKNGIETRLLMPLLNQPCYRGMPWIEGAYPQAERALKDGFYIGCHPGMTNADIDFVVWVFRRYFQKVYRRPP